MNGDRPSVGFLPFYVDYYEGICRDFPAEKATVAQRCADTLARFGTVKWDGALIGDTETAESVGTLMASEKPDCVVVVTTIAVFSGICWAAVKGIEAPILLWNPQLIETVGEGYAMEDIVRNTSQIGTQALANTLLREGRCFHVVTGFEGSDRTIERLRRYFSVIGTVKALGKACFLAVGEAFPLMTDILIDEHELERRVGATVVRVDGAELTRRYHQVDDTKVTDRLRQMREAFTVRNLTDDEAARSARLCEAFSELVEEHGADAGSFNCHGEVCLRNPEIGITGCYGHGIQNALGRPFTCTGDLPTAFAMLLLKRLTGVSMYTEVQVMDERREALVIANSGEGEAGILRKGECACVVGNSNFLGKHGRGASFSYPLETGPATILSFTPVAGGYRLIAAEGEILEDTLPDSGALAGFFRFANADLHTGYTRWLEAGSVHHAATTLGHWGREIGHIADLMNFEYISI
jgi:L-arabinose isomerase